MNACVYIVYVVNVYKIYKYNIVCTSFLMLCISWRVTFSSISSACACLYLYLCLERASLFVCACYTCDRCSIVVCPSYVRLNRPTFPPSSTHNGTRKYTYFYSPAAGLYNVSKTESFLTLRLTFFRISYC